MDKSKIMKQLMTTFLGELEDHVRTFTQDLEKVKKNPAGVDHAERFKTLLRTAHSLKGAARSVNVNMIESACHYLEEILIALRDGRLPPEASPFKLLFAAVDAIEEAGKRLREQPDVAGAPLANLLPQLEAAARDPIAGSVSPVPETPSKSAPQPPPS